jgi:excisionase family DNA binding protein
MSFESIIREIVRSEFTTVAQEIHKSLSELKEHRKQVHYVTREEAAKQLRISLPTLDKLTRSGELISLRKGKRVLYDDSQFESFFEKVNEPDIRDFFEERTAIQSEKYGKNYTDSAIIHNIARQGVDHREITPDMIEWYRQRYKLNKVLKNKAQ